MKRLLTILIVCCLALGVRAALPGVQLKDLSGKPVNTAKLTNNGKPMIISFWATWCKPCIRELKAIHELYPEWQDETGVRIIIVSIDDAQNAQKVKPMVDGMGWEYDVLLDPNSEFLKALGGQMIPFVVVVDGNGNVVSKHSGYTDGAENELIEEVRKLLAQ